jgi:lysophospholipase L1-like esterase
MAKIFDVAPQDRDVNIVYEGDSGHSGKGCAYRRRASWWLPRHLGRPVSVKNLGISGYQLSAMVSNYATRLGAAFKPGAVNIAMILGGANDIGGAGLSAIQTYALLASLVSAAKATGYTAVVGTLFPSSTFYSGKETIRTDYIAAIKANAAGADAIVDYTANPVIGTDAAATDTTLYWDNIHRTEVAHNISAQMDAAAIRPFLPYRRT